MRIENKKIRQNYEVVESFEAGIVLTGAETKSIKAGQVNLRGARVIIRKKEVWLLGMQVARYKHDGRVEKLDLARARKLLMKRREIEQIESKARLAGLTLLPISVYNKGSFVKVEVGLVRGKKKYEKREELKKRKEKRDLARRLKSK